ncbi:MAG TPA: hypothetical protein VEB22_12125 [Phycisphaerales bacterium]|nr:hypothetical protein [Phycisphaerales bacterium]
MYRILHVGFGPLGQRIVGDVYARRLGEVAALVDTSRELAGRRLRDYVPQAKADLPVTASLDEALASGRFDAAVVTTSSDLRKCMDVFRSLLSAGLPVVSTCEELVFPWLRHAGLAQELDSIARRAGGRIMGTGVNPGAMMDTIPVFVTAVCSKVQSVEVHRIQDASTRRLPFQKKIGAGLDDAQFADGIKGGWLRHVGLGESMHFVAHYLGLPFDEWEETIEMVRAQSTLQSGLGPIEPGRAAGVRQVAVGTRGGKSVVTMVFQAAIGQTDPAPQDRVIIRGEPSIDVSFSGGVHGDIATSAMTLNAIPSLLNAPPGLHTSATVPLLHIARGG